MTVIVDGRGRRGSGIDSNTRWKKRVQVVASEHFKKAANKELEGDFRHAGKGGIDVAIPAKSIKHPSIKRSGKGQRHIIAPGNGDFEAGDEIPRPKCGGIAGASDTDFLTHLDREELKRYILQNLGLAYLEKRMIGGFTETHVQRAGFTLQGAFHNIDLRMTKLNMMGRHIASSSTAWNEILECLYRKKEILALRDPLAGQASSYGAENVDYVSKALEAEIMAKQVDEISRRVDMPLDPDAAAEIARLDQDISRLSRSIGAIPYFDDAHDPRYRKHEVRPLPVQHAVIFCDMDVSGSITEEMRKNAKLFYWLLYTLLESVYGEGRVNVVFLKHTEKASEVDYETFFGPSKSGGTVVSSVLKLQLQIMQERYNDPNWNIYTAQVSDGDNQESDNPEVEHCIEEIMKKSQQFVYMETRNPNRHAGYGGFGDAKSDLWDLYEAFAKKFGDRFKIASVLNRDDVVPIFRKMYERAAQEQRAAAYMP